MKILNKLDAQKLVRNTISVEPSLIAWSKHCKTEMMNDDLILNDLINVLKNGEIKRKADLDTDSNDYVYRIETTRIAVIFKFKEFMRGNSVDIGIKLITCWRKSKR